MINKNNTCSFKRKEESKMVEIDKDEKESGGHYEKESEQSLKPLLG